MDRNIVYVILFVNLVVATFYYLNKKCEIPLFLAAFNILVEYRVITLEIGNAQFVNFNYGIDFEFNLEMAYIISELILLGTSVLMYAFMFFYVPSKRKLKDNNQYLQDFIVSRKKYIIIGLGVFSFFQIVLSGNISDGYGNLSKLANSSFIILMFLIFLNTKNTKIINKIMYLLAFVIIGYITYNPGLRFQFLGWMIPIGYFLMRNLRTTYKLYIMGVGMFVILIIFSAAGVLRYSQADTISTEELYDESYARLEESDDVNFIDGFMMMYQVYPEYLDYTKGIEHLNILLRPIPRTLWAGKPLAGWFQNYQEKYGMELVKVGFSPTLYGVFYAEGGVYAIPFFAILWAAFLAWLYRSLTAYTSDLSYLLIGVLLTALIPIFRSGDLAGDFAIVLMSYWPIIYFVYKYKKYVKKRIRYENA